ncbi:MAG: cupredoxin domain-containing protein [Thermodesulfobacteriota bacterium]
MKKIAITLLLVLSLVPLGSLYAEDSNTSGEVQKVEIIVDSYSFRPESVTVDSGKPVEITLRSIASSVPHDFTINDPESGFTITQGVKGGRDATFTFTPENPGTYKFYCSKKGLFGGTHEEKGMVGTLVVN